MGFFSSNSQAVSKCARLAATMIVMTTGDCLTAYAQDNAPTNRVPVVQISPETTSDFRRAMGYLAVQGHVAIAVEGVPLHETLSPEEIATLSDLSASGPLPETVARIASLYGYSVAQSRSVFALSKRYDDPEDLPAASLEEMNASMAKITRMLKLFNPVVESHTKLVGDIYKSLTPGQREDLPKHTLSIGSLDANAHELVRSAALVIYVGMQSNKAIDVAYRLKHSAGAELSLAPPSATAPRGQAPAGGILIHLEGESVTRQIGRNPRGSGNPAADATAEAEVVTTLKIKLAKEGLIGQPALTLAQSALSLSVAGPRKFNVAPDVKDRPVQIFGTGNAPSVDIFHALGFACGLRVTSDESGANYTISPALALPPASADGLSRAVRQALPDTFLRACGIERVFESDRFRQITAISPRGDELAAKFRPSPDNPFPMEKDWLMQIAAAHRLKAVLSLMLSPNAPAQTPPAVSRTTVSVANLDPVTRSALGALALAEFAGQLDRQFPLEPMPFLTNLDQDVLGGGIRADKRGRQKLDIEFLVRRTDGGPGLQTVASIGGVNPPDLSAPNATAGAAP